MTRLNFVKQDGQYIGHGDSLLFHHQDTLCTFIENQVRNTPNAVALSFEDSQVTFKELLEKSSQLAHYLVGCGVHPKDKVALYLETGIEMVIAIIAIIKTGSCYIPLDVHYPQERIAFMVKDSDSRVLITQSNLNNQVDSLDLSLR